MIRPAAVRDGRNVDEAVVGADVPPGAAPPMRRVANVHVAVGHQLLAASSRAFHHCSTSA
jgi:hypothetical protein